MFNLFTKQCQFSLYKFCYLRSISIFSTFLSIFSLTLKTKTSENHFLERSKNKKNPRYNTTHFFLFFLFFFLVWTLARPRFSHGWRYRPLDGASTPASFLFGSRRRKRNGDWITLYAESLLFGSDCDFPVNPSAKSCFGFCPPPHFRSDSAISTEFTTRFLHRVFHFSRSIRMSALHGISWVNKEGRKTWSLFL